MAYDDIINKYKKHLTKAQIKALADMEQKYRNLYSQQRAQALNEMTAQGNSMQRALQNMGLAGRHGKLISGVQKAGNERLTRSYGDYHTQLGRAQNAQLERAAIRMANETIKRRNAAAEAEYKRKLAEYERLLAEQKRQQQEYNDNFTDPRLTTNMTAPEKAALANAIKHPQYDPDQMTDPRMGNMTAPQKAQLAKSMKQYTVMGEIDPRQAYISGTKNPSDMRYRSVATRYANKTAEIEQKTATWQQKISRGIDIKKPKNRNEFEIMQEAKRARNDWIAAEREREALMHPEVASLITLSDSDFNLRYDAAERSYKLALQNAKILRQDDSSSMEFSNANEIEANATLEFTKWQRAKKARDNAMVQFYNDSVAVEAKDAPTAPAWTNYAAPDNWQQVYAKIKDGTWRASDYDTKNADKGERTESKYSALVNEWSFINGNTVGFYSFRGNLNDFFNDIDESARSLSSLFSANGVQVTSKNAYAQFRNQCTNWFYNLHGADATTKQKDQMTAYLTLANLMTADERARFNALLDQNGKEDADEYFEFLYNNVLPDRLQQQVDLDYDAMLRRESVYDENGNRIGSKDGSDTWLGQLSGSIWSIPGNIVQGATAPMRTMLTGQDDVTAARLGAMRGNTAQGMRNAIQENFSESGRFWYGTGMSAADSATVAMISGGIGNLLQGVGVAANVATKAGSALGGLLLGGASFNASYDEALQRGLSPDKARMTAVGNGINEMLFETLSIGTLLEKTGKSAIKVSKDAWKNVVVNTLVQAGVEGSEEVFTDIANKIWDDKLNGIYSEELQKIREYVDEGYTYDQARDKVKREYAEQLGLSFLGGAVSGGFMGGGAQGINALRNRGFERYGKQMDADAKAEVRNFDFKDEQMQELAKQDKLTNQDYGVLAAAMLQQRFEEGRAYVQNALKDGTITKEQKELYDKYAQMAKDGKLTAEVVASEEYAQDMDKLEPVFDIMDEGELIQQGMRDLAEAQRAVRDENAKYDKQVAEIENDNTLTDAEKQQKIDAIENERGEKVVEKVRDLEKVQKKYDENVKAENGKVETKRGNLTYDFKNAKTFDEMDNRQKAAIRFAKLFADKYGMNIKVVDDSVAGERIDGEYNSKTNTITVNISGSNSVMYTVSHEITHWLQRNQSKAYNTLKSAIEKELSRTDLLVSELPKVYQDIMGDYKTEDNTVMDALVKYEQDMYKRQTGETQSKELAEDEVVARCCESFLKDRGFAQKMVAENPGTARTIAAKLRQLANDVKTLNEDALERGYEKYGDLIDNSLEKAALEQIGDIEKIARMWENGLRKVAKKNKASGDTKNEDIRYSIRGRGALYSKPGSLDVRDLRDKQGKANLNIAYKMDRDGIDSEKIRLATGWFKGYDGKWRNEIDDSEAKLADWLVLGKAINYMEEKARKAEGDLWDRISSLEDRLKKSNKVNGSDSEQSKALRKELRQTKKQREEALDFSNRISTNRLKLSDILDHAKLYENYPQLKDVSVHLSYSDRTGGYLGSATGTTDITIVTDRNSKGEILETLMHEVQHIIQGIEGFAKGANVEYWADRNKRESADVKEAKATLAQVERELARVKYDGNPQASPLKSAVSYAYITDLLRTDKPGTANYAYDTEQKEKYEKRAEEGGYAELLQKYLFAYQDVKVAEMEAKDYTKAFADYQRTAGEVEARDVASRLHMSEDERKATRPDIDRSDVTFFETDRTGEDAWKNEDIRFSLNNKVERVGDLIAVHNLSGDQLLKSVELGGFPMPSIAVMKQTQGHDRYGDVSVIFGKDTIDPQKSTANKVYGGDAWTPTYPTVEYKPRKTVADRIRKTYFDIARKYGYDAARPMYGYVYELERKLNNAGSEKALLDDLYNDIDIMRMYGQINGIDRVEDVYKETRTEMSESDKAVPQYLIKAFGEDFIRGFATPDGENPLQHRREFVQKHMKELDRVFGKMLREEFSFDEAQMLNVVENMTTREYMSQLQRALKIVNNDTVKIDRVYDRTATERAIRDSIDQKAYKEWVYDLFHGVIEKSGIRNNKSYYTDSGNQRSWDALHEDETLENVVRVMKQETDKGAKAFFSQSEMLALGTRNFRSIDEIREHKDQLQHISDEDMSAAKQRIVDGFGELMDEMRDKSEKNYFIGRDRALEAMVDAVRRTRTPQGILNELRQWHGLNVTDDMGRRIADLMDEIADLPTEYFEAKPRRAVGLDEIKAVIMPQGEYAELKTKLDERGIPVVEYEKDNTEDRLRALNSDEVNKQRFSMNDKDFVLKKKNGEKWYELRDAKAKVYGSSVELEGGSLLNRVRMMQNLAEMYGSVTVDATSEKEAEAFKRAGAKQETDAFSNSEYGTWEFTHTENKYEQDTRYDAKQKRNFANAVLKEVGTYRNFKREDLRVMRAKLEKAFAVLHNAWHGDGDQLVAMEYADKLFDQILNRYTEMSEADADTRDALLAEMPVKRDARGREYREVEVTATQMAEIKNQHTVAEFNAALSKALGTRVVVKQTENAKTLEDVFKDNPYLDATTNEGDMPMELLNKAEETVGKRTNPYKAENEERAALKEAMYEKALDIVGIEKSTAQKVREAVKQVRAEERAKAKTKVQTEVEKARLAERMHEGAIRAKERRAFAERESNIKRDAAKREAKLKDVTKQKLEQQKLNTLRRDVKTIALKWNQRLVKMLANPTEASHVPVQLAREVAELTKTITEYIDSGTERGRINLDKVIKAYQQAFDDQATIIAAKKENRKYDPRGSVIDREMYDEQLVNMIDEMNEILADKSFKELSAREMMGLLNIIRGVAHTVYDANRMIGTTERKAIWQVGDKMVKELESAPKVKGGFARFFLEESLDLRRIAKVFSGSNENAEFVKLSDMLNRGAIEKERVAQVLSGMFDPLTQQYGEEIRKWYGKNAEWIDTGITKNGRKVEITKGMRVSLAMHVLNAGNMRHIENGGVTIPNRELYAKGKLADAYANGTLVRLNADQINTIISQMTEAEKAYVEVAKEFFHQRTGYYVNKTSLQLLGYRKATVENYFPIHTDRNYTKSDFASVVRDGSIEGQGFLKERVMASNPVYLEDITSVVNRQIKGVSLYAGLAVPMRNFNAVMNASVYEDENGNWVPRTTVRKAMTQSMGEYGAKVVQGFLQDVSGMSAVDVTPGEQLVAKLQTRYVKAVLLANLKVSLKQAASYPTAAAVIPWKYLSKALRKGESRVRKPGHIYTSANVDLINQYTPLYKMRLDGMANEITSIMAERGLEQKMPWLLGWITKMDVATVGRLWSAAEYMVTDQQNLPVGSDEYYKAVAEVFNQTIQQTQPNFTPLQRNAALRSKNPVVRTLTLFGTQRMQNGGILIESAMELAHSKNMSKEAQAVAKAKFGRAVVSQLVQNVMLVAIGFVVDVIRGRMTAWQDDDKDVTLESVAKVMGDQFLGNIFGSFLGGTEAWDIISTAFKRATNANAYDTEFTVPSLDAIETIIGFFNKDSVSFVQYMSGNHTAEEKIARLKSFSFKVAKAAGYLTGFPFENIAKTIVKGWIPALQDIKDYADTGELIPWLHQSGKLDKAKTAANYKEWTKAGFSGRDYFYYEKMMSDVKGGREGRIPVLLQSDLTNEQKAMLMRMFDTSGATSDGTKVYAKNGDLVIDFAAPTEKQQALPMPSAEPSAEPTPTAEPTATPNPLSEAKQEGVRQAVAKGVDEKTANEAFLHYQDLYGTEGRDEEFRSWLFENVKSPENRAVLEYHVLGRASSVEGAVTYRQDGSVYRDYTNESWYTLSTNKSKRYEAGKRLEKTGLSVDKTVEIYNGLADYTKKAEWKEYLKKQGLTDEQITIFLWSRGWAKID